MTEAKMKENKNDNQDFQWAFGLNKFILDLMGIWPGEETNEKNSIFKLLCVPILVLIMLSLFLPQIYALTHVYRQLPLVVDNLTMTCVTITSATKLFLLWSNQQVLKPVIKSAINDWTNITSPLKRKIMTRQARRGRMFTMGGYGIMSFSLVTLYTTPMFGVSVRIINNITDPANGKFFPLQTFYPFDVTFSPYFELFYTMQLIASSFVAMSFSVPDNFFGALVFHASAQCKILEKEMKELLPIINAKRIIKQAGGEKSFIRVRLKQLVDTHVHLIRFVEGIENCFNVLILAQVVGLSLIICCLGLGVIKLGLSFVQFTILMGTLFNAMIHMLIYCFASEILGNHSSEFFYAVYSTNWFTLPSNISRDIIIVMIRSKSQLQLTAGKFFPLSFELYLKILKTAFGYVSILLAVMD